MKKLLLILAILLLIASVDARVPKVGDHVRISFMGHQATISGNITEIENGMICLNNSSLEQNNIEEVGNTCIGIGQIAVLSWPKT
jgi:hypothetical protein